VSEDTGTNSEQQQLDKELWGCLQGVWGHLFGRTVSSSNWTRNCEGACKVSEDTDSGEQRATATGQGIMRIFACCKGILKANKRSVLPDFSAWLVQLIFRDFCNGICTVGHRRWFRWQACSSRGSALSLKCNLFFILYFAYLLLVSICLFIFKTDWKHPPHFKYCVCGEKSVSTYAVSTKVGPGRRMT
jgi:hypothetical protein